MRIKIIGVMRLHAALVEMTSRIGDLSIVTEQLDEGMNKYAHVITGFMKSTIYHTFNIAGADAYYAGREADRGGSHDYAQRAIDVFDPSDYLDKITRAF